MARRYDQLTREAAIELLIHIVVDAVETPRRYAEQNPRFVRCYIDETAYRRWSRSEAAKTFIDSPSFTWLLGAFGLDPTAARKNLLRRAA